MVDQKAKEMEPVETQTVEIMPPDIENLIYVVRNKQVMVDSDLAMLYQVETKALNRAVKRNIKRFPEDFCFQLTTEETESLKCQSGTSKIQEPEKKDGRGGNQCKHTVNAKNNMLILHAATFPCLYQNNVLPCMDSLPQHN